MTGQLRQRLPNRRQSEVFSFEHGGVKFHGSVSWFDGPQVADGTLVVGGCVQPAEVFLDASKPGSPMQAMARDAAVIASLALQYGCPLATMRAALTRDDDEGPAGPLGRLLDLIDDIAGYPT